MTIKMEISVSRISQQSESVPVLTEYETWPGNDGDPLPVGRWETAGYGEGTINQTGDGYARLIVGDTGGFYFADGVPIRSLDALEGEVRFSLRWEMPRFTDVTVQPAFCVQDDQDLQPYDQYPSNGYYIPISVNGETMFLSRRIADEGQSMDTGDTFANIGLTPPNPGVIWNFALSADGTTVNATIWDDGDPRPETPTFSGTDGTYSSGKVRFTMPGPFAVIVGGEINIGPISSFS